MHGKIARFEEPFQHRPEPSLGTQPGGREPDVAPERAPERRAVGVVELPGDALGGPPGVDDPAARVEEARPREEAAGRGETARAEPDAQVGPGESRDRKSVV